MRRCYLFMIVFFVLLKCASISTINDSYIEGDYRRVVSLCRDDLATDSTNADLYFLLGQAYRNLEKPDSAVTALEQANFLKPEDENIRTTYYQALIELGDSLSIDNPKSGIDVYERAIAVDSSSSTAYVQKGHRLFELGDYEMAKQCYKKALSIKADGILTTRLAKIDSINNSAEILLEKSVSALELNDYDQAKALARKALKIKPDYKEAQYQLYIVTGLAFYKKGSVNDLWEAIDNFGRASLLYPHRGEPHYYSALAYTKKDKDEYSNAIDELERAIELDPQGEWVLEAKAELRRVKERKKKMDEFWGR